VLFSYIIVSADLLLMSLVIRIVVSSWYEDIINLCEA